jgi:hypothetical protein
MPSLKFIKIESDGKPVYFSFRFFDNCESLSDALDVINVDLLHSHDNDLTMT